MKEEGKGESTGPVVDFFKLVTFRNVTPSELDEPPPEDWDSTWKRFNKAMMRIIAGIPSLLAEALEGTTRLIRGASMPPAAENRIYRAHAEADFQEESLQAQLTSDLETDCGAMEQDSSADQEIRQLLQRIHAKGFSVKAAVRDDGLVVVSIVRPELEDVAEEVAQDLPERTIQSKEEVTK